MSERWWRRKRRFDFGFGDFFEEADMMEKMMDDMIQRAFGNSMEKEKTQRDYLDQFRSSHSDRNVGAQIKEEYEPLVDVFVDTVDVVVVAELLGVGKDYIEVNAAENKVTICVNSSKSHYYKEITLPAKVDPKSLATSYRNGVLEVRLKKQIGERLFIR